MTDDEQQLRNQRLEQLKAQMEEKQAHREQENEAQQKIEQMLARVLEPTAKERLSNVRLVNNERYLKTVQAILYLAQHPQFQGKISDEQVKQILQRLSEKRETTIKRK
jgi:programmed cell death protein 5